jgi:hypothetical protein
VVFLSDEKQLADTLAVDLQIFRTIGRTDGPID